MEVTECVRVKSSDKATLIRIWSVNVRKSLSQNLSVWTLSNLSDLTVYRSSALKHPTYTIIAKLAVSKISAFPFRRDDTLTVHYYKD